MRETRMIQARRLTMILPAMTLADIHDFPSPATVSRVAHHRAGLRTCPSSGMASNRRL
jgi:hypothetical protein